MLVSPARLDPLVSPATLVAALQVDPTIRLLDVRTPAEFETAHLAGAYNVPLHTLHEHSAEIRAVVQTSVVLICQTGGRARKAEEALRQAGMEQLHILDGGVSAWMQQGQAVSCGPKRVSLERQVRIVAGLFVALGSLASLLFGSPFAVVPLLVGSGLVFSGITDTCTMGLILARLPFNRPASCDIPAAIRALAGTP